MTNVCYGAFDISGLPQHMASRPGAEPANIQITDWLYTSISDSDNMKWTRGCGLTHLILLLVGHRNLGRNIESS